MSAPAARAAARTGPGSVTAPLDDCTGGPRDHRGARAHFVGQPGERDAPHPHPRCAWAWNGNTTELSRRRGPRPRRRRAGRPPRPRPSRRSGTGGHACRSTPTMRAKSERPPRRAHRTRSARRASLPTRPGRRASRRGSRASGARPCTLRGSPSRRRRSPCPQRSAQSVPSHQGSFLHSQTHNMTLWTNSIPSSCACSARSRLGLHQQGATSLGYSQPAVSQLLVRAERRLGHHLVLARCARRHPHRARTGPPRSTPCRSRPP